MKINKKILAVILTVSIASTLTACSNSNSVIAQKSYTVKSGDTLYSIACDVASKHADKNININALVYEIRKENNVKNGLIVPGQKIKIPGGFGND